MMKYLPVLAAFLFCEQVSAQAMYLWRGAFYYSTDDNVQCSHYLSDPLNTANTASIGAQRYTAHPDTCTSFVPTNAPGTPSVSVKLFTRFHKCMEDDNMLWYLRYYPNSVDCTGDFQQQEVTVNQCVRLGNVNFYWDALFFQNPSTTTASGTSLLTMWDEEGRRDRLCALARQEYFMTMEEIREERWVNEVQGSAHGCVMPNNGTTTLGSKRPTEPKRQPVAASASQSRLCLRECNNHCCSDNQNDCTPVVGQYTRRVRTCTNKRAFAVDLVYSDNQCREQDLVNPTADLEGVTAFGACVVLPNTVGTPTLFNSRRVTSAPGNIEGGICDMVEYFPDSIFVVGTNADSFVSYLSAGTMRSMYSQYTTQINQLNSEGASSLAWSAALFLLSCLLVLA